MDFSKVVAEKIAGEKHDLYDIKNKFSSAVLMFAAALLACMVLYHAAPALQVYSSGPMAFSPAESNVSSSSVSEVLDFPYLTPIFIAVMDISIYLRVNYKAVLGSNSSF